MTVIGIIGAGEVGTAIARAAIGVGHEVVLANSRGPETLASVIADLGPRACAATAAEAAAAGEFVVLAVPYRPDQALPVEELAGKVVLDTNNHMVWRDGVYPRIASGEVTEHELRQEQLPQSQVVKAFTHIQAPSLLVFARPAGRPDRVALTYSSDHPDAAQVAAGFYEELGFDAVDSSPLSESWRSVPGTPLWSDSFEGRQDRARLVRNLAAATPVTQRP